MFVIIVIFSFFIQFYLNYDRYQFILFLLDILNRKEPCVRHYANNGTDSAFNRELKYSQLLQEKNDSEQFIKLIAPKYLGVYVVDKQTDHFREIITPEYFPTLSEVDDWKFSMVLNLYRNRFVKESYRAVFDHVMDYEYVYSVLKRKSELCYLYRKMDGDLVKLQIKSYSKQDENLSIWIFTSEESDDAIYESLGTARWKIIFDEDENPLTYHGNHALCRMFQYAYEDFSSGFRSFLSYVHPEDVDKVKQSIDQFKALRNLNEQHDDEFRLRNSNGEYQWVHSIGKTVWNKNGKIKSVCGIFIDINARKQKEEKQRRIIDGLANEYVTMWLIHDDQSCELCRYKYAEWVIQESLDAFSKINHYTESMRDYAEHYIDEENRAQFLKDTAYEKVLKEIQENPIYQVIYQRNAYGQLAYYQISFAKLDKNDNSFVMGFKDVNEVVLEEIKKNNQLEAALHKIEKEKDILDKLCSDFTAVYFVELNSKTFESVHISSNTNAEDILRKQVFYNFDSYCMRYASSYISESDKKDFLKWFKCENLKKNLTENNRIAYHYQSFSNKSHQKYFEAQAIKVKEDEKHCYALLGFRYIDDIMEKEKAIQEQIQKAYEEVIESNEIISAIAKSYCHIYLINLEKDEYEEISHDSTVHHFTGNKGCASKRFKERCEENVELEYREMFYEFTNFETIQNHLAKDDETVTEYKMLDGNWHRLVFIAKNRDENGKVIEIICTIRSISEVKRRELNLHYEAEEARHEVEAKNRFLSNMSHDIRTPLNGMIGMLRMAEQYPDDLEMRQSLKAKVNESLDYLVTLINNILELNKLETDKTKIVCMPFNMIEVIQDACFRSYRKAKEKNITFHMDVDKKSIQCPYVVSNATYIDRIFANLTENAVKFTEENGNIDVYYREIHHDDTHVTVEFGCKDGGIGMSEEFMKYAFDAFSQEKKTSRSKYEGSGLGLSIVKKLVDKLDGTIEVASKKNVGTDIKICMTFEIGEEVNSNSILENYSDLKGLRALVVEDNELNTEVVKFLLEKNGIIVDCVGDGVQALESFEKSSPGYYAMILMDILMPRMNGLEATRRIRTLQRKDASLIPIIAMSANAFSDDIMRGKMAGMNDYLAKPLDEEMLIRAIRKCLK